jgi:succinate dehydrogenase / fumarate reductase flavoprotein subunit
MHVSLQAVEATRARRLQETFALLTGDEKQRLLHGFHPDFRSDGFRQIRVGPNKGERALNALVDLLESRSHLAADALDLVRGGADSACVRVETDVLILGGGGAGAAAALLAREGGAQVILATKLRFGDANTMMAQGGIQAADKPADSPAIHYLDAFGGGGFTNDPNLVEALVRDAPRAIQWLEGLGVMFDKEPDGSMTTIHGGGTSRKRMHSAGDYTGAAIMRALRDEVLSCTDAITVLEFAPALELLLDDRGQVAGAVLENLETRERTLVRSKCTILATGDSGRLHHQGFETTNHYGATGDGLVLAYRVGARLVDADTYQYHPTGAAFPEQIVGQLVTEKVRGLGAQVTNVDGEQFVNPRETRDAEASAIIRECLERRKGVRTPSGRLGVWLDSPMIEIVAGPGTIEQRLPAMVRQFKRFGIDITREPMLVYPTAHYQNGGVAIHADGAVQGIPNLYAAGAVTGGVHGRNRLMGNSLLEIVVFGRRAGQAAALRAQDVRPGAPTLAHVDAWHRALEEAGIEVQTTARPAAPILLPDYTRKVAWTGEVC